MEIRILSGEIIKPSSPTPNQLRTHKLCLLEQLVPPHVHFPFIFFYSAATKDPSKTSIELKLSLSQTLTYYYPFAGRLKDGSFIDCDDSGVTFIEAQVAGNMSEVLKEPEMDLLEQLLPFKADEKLSTLVVVQVSYFDCGGMAIGVCFSHFIADATAAANFVKNWAALASCRSIDIKDVIFDCTSIFPPQDVLGLTDSVCERCVSYVEIKTKRFVFDAAKIAALREEIGNVAGLDRPTRVEAVSTLILSAVIAAAARETNEFSSTILAASFPVNLRKRMNPPLPEECVGNICTTTTLMCPMNERIDHKSLAKMIHESIRMVDDQFVRNVYGGGEFLNFLKNAVEGLSKNRIFWNSSWCKLPFYEADFGWGKPKWIATIVRDDKVAMLVDTSDGEGIEVWMGLPKEDMAKFEQDPGILAYSSVSPSPF
ncbi:stemmadenine O-acetyltransferase-like isoform X1 [Mangifera indica]|uniref:stemmadenine O-acetyltransferase-like isoform X1 n=1 Tax=Mangifera indica TaxID=29780 RepID=UPI001CF97D89|nr:stemmadenine O-acetyltransferase-like isoform X1 [Mangifera indica]